MATLLWVRGQGRSRGSSLELNTDLAVLVVVVW